MYSLSKTVENRCLSGKDRHKKNMFLNFYLIAYIIFQNGNLEDWKVKGRSQLLKIIKKMY